MPNPNKGKTTEQINPYYFTQHETKEGKQRFSHTYASYADAEYYLKLIQMIPTLISRINSLEARVSALEGRKGSSDTLTVPEVKGRDVIPDKVASSVVK